MDEPVFLNLDKPAVVKWSFQADEGVVKSFEQDFSKASRCVAFEVPIDMLRSSVTLRILSLELP